MDDRSCMHRTRGCLDEGQDGAEKQSVIPMSTLGGLQSTTLGER